MNYEYWYKPAFYYIYMNKNPQTIGERIREVFDKSGLTVLQFAELLGCDRTDVYNIFRRKKIDIYLLCKISQALNHDFVTELLVEYGFSKDIPSSKVSLILEINNMDDKMLNKLLKTIKQLDVKGVREEE